MCAGSLNDLIYAPWVPLHVAFAQSGTYSGIKIRSLII